MLARIPAPIGLGLTPKSLDIKALPPRGVVCLLLAVFLTLAACTGESVESAEESRPAGATPSITLLSPRSHDVITGDTLTVNVQVENFIMDPLAIGKAKAPGRGHWHLYLNGEWVATSAEMEFELDDISPGPHHLRVALANNDHSPVPSSIEDRAIIEVKSSDAKSQEVQGASEEEKGVDSPKDELPSDFQGPTSGDYGGDY